MVKKEEADVVYVIVVVCFRIKMLKISLIYNNRSFSMPTTTLCGTLMGFDWP